MNIRNLFGNRKKNEPVRLQFNGSLGLIPSQIIYVEGRHNKYVNTLIKDNYGKLANGCARKGLDFVYFPKMEKDFSNRTDLSDLLQYVYPWLPKKLLSGRVSSFRPRAVHTKQWFDALGYEAHIQPGLFRLAPHPESAKTFVFEYFPFNLSKKKTLLQQWENYIATLPFEMDEPDEEPAITPTFNRDVRARSENVELNSEIEKLKDEIEELSIVLEKREAVSEKRMEVCLLKQVSAKKQELERSIPAMAVYGSQSNYEVADAFYSRKYDVVEKIKRNILEARQLGIYEEVIKLLVSDTDVHAGTEIKLSRLVIDSDYRLFLPDYGSMEIKLSTLPKALFILFLLHPEGIVLKQLSDYEPELLKIYKIISNRENLDNMTDSVKRVCSPSDKSINEKLSRIREAFVRVIAETCATHYYITGERGEKKQIKLDRTFVSLPKELESPFHTPPFLPASPPDKRIFPFV